MVQEGHVEVYNVVLIDMGMKNIAACFLAGYLALAGSGCRGECRKDPLTREPEINNPHPSLFSEVYHGMPDVLDGDFVLRYRWDSNSKSRTSGVDQMDSIRREISGDKVSGYKTSNDSLFLRVEDDSNGKADSNGDGTKDYVGRITQKNRKAVSDFGAFHEFATGILAYKDAIQNAEFHIKENIIDIDDFKVFGVGNTGLYHSLPRIGDVRADVVIRYKDGSVDAIVFDTFSLPINSLPQEDLERMEQYFSLNPGGVFANSRLFVFIDGHTQEVSSRLKENARELRRSVMDKALIK